MDAWIGQLGVYVTSHMDSLGQGLRIERAVGARQAARSSDTLGFAQAMLSSNEAVRAQQISPYIVNLEKNGKLSDQGKFRTSPDDLHEMAQHYLPGALADWNLTEDDPTDIAPFHLIGHSAGAIFHAHLLPELLRAKMTVRGIYWMAPACRVDLFQQKVLPAYEAAKVAPYTQFQLSDKLEQDDNCAGLYNRSVLYLVSNSCERKPGTPILGMEKFIDLVKPGKPPSSKVKVWDFVSAPTAANAGLTVRSRATSHTAFDTDAYTMRAILERIKKA
ncbi:MAG: hypothetical protein J2P31_00880 [Blastocatellia bacterium]|nr:hypothetical protein [Blastocatellia bacterium]